MFSILIPTFNNIKYLELCINSITKNSKYNHQIIAHVNIGDDGTIEYLDKTNIEYTHTKYNSGICEGINKAAKLAKHDYLLYAHDDFYFTPNWDMVLESEIKKRGAKCAFPVNTSINEVAAHYTAEPNDEITITDNDLVKIDLGAQIDGYIADTAVTVCYNPEFDIDNLRIFFK